MTAENMLTYAAIASIRSNFVHEEAERILRTVEWSGKGWTFTTEGKVRSVDRDGKLN